MADYGTFTKDGITRQAHSPADRVAFRFAGWSEKEASAKAKAKTDDGPKPPPKGGAGSGQPEWLAYARTFGDVDVADDATRDDIVTALTSAGHPTE